MKSRILFLQILGVLLLGVLPATAGTVTNTNDSGGGSLRQAIADAFPGETIDFLIDGCPCTIKLTSGELNIDQSLRILGPGSDLLAISGNETFRVVRIGRNAIVEITGLAITGGRAPYGTGEPGSYQCTYGGGILNLGVLTVKSSKITRNLSPDGYGGGVDSLGASIHIADTEISQNAALSGPNCLVDTAHGGGIYAAGPSIVITNSRVLSNVSGGVAVWSLLRLERSTVQGNDLCGICFNFSDAFVVQSTIDGNLGDGVVGFGGLRLLESTVSHNSGIGVAGAWKVWNSTISGNLVGITYSCSIGAGFGGDETGRGITSSTITNNAHGVSSWGDKFCSSPALQNSIIAGNSINDLNGDDLISRGFNLIGRAGPFAAIFHEPGDQFGTIQYPLNPNLFPLSFNGGPTQTHALRPDSTAIDMGNSFGTKADQRGVFRPLLTADWLRLPGDGSDIGAYEVNNSTSSGADSRQIMEISK